MGNELTRSHIGKNLGRRAEDLAKEYFLQQGYRLLERNFRAGPGEIDLILEKDDLLVFVEVKARRSLRYGLPQEAVTRLKQETIRRVAEAYMLRGKGLNRKVRFDVLAITFPGPEARPRFEHIPFAF